MKPGIYRSGGQMKFVIAMSLQLVTEGQHDDQLIEEGVKALRRMIPEARSRWLSMSGAERQAAYDRQVRLDEDSGHGLDA